METLVAAACLALPTGAAHAAATPLANALISASYNGDSAAILSLDSGFTAGLSNSNSSHLDPTNVGVEFYTADFQFGFDFAASGLLTVYAADPVIVAGTHVARFDFGSSLPAAITGFALSSAGDTSGTPVYRVIDGHTIEIDLSAVSWNSTYASFDSTITLASPVPEPFSAGMMMAGLGLVALRRRRKGTAAN
ncbi:PEP-CTERM sorting domain-containing protein [Oxalobacteraceae bacterium A2-2]